MYTAPLLVQLLEQQHKKREGQSGLFKKGIFVIQWRTKVGSFPHPDGETIVSAGEPCGNWEHDNQQKLNVGDNWQQFKKLPLHGYIPGSCIRGLVRSWAKKRPDLLERMNQLLGYQNDDQIIAGKVEFLDAWPTQPTKLSLDIVTPQEDFQVLHKSSPTPLSFYTLGDGKDLIPLNIAIRGIIGKATKSEIEEVWQWVEQALGLYGVGSRTASGYGQLKANSKPRLVCDLNHAIKRFDFTLYSQGSAGVHISEDIDLRPSHWRGWLRSWTLRFLLGVMSKDNAQKTLAELMGTIEPQSRQGCVQIKIIKGQIWGQRSNDQPRFYTWNGSFEIIAPKDILKQIILPIIKIASTVGGLGRGWRRPLHIFQMNNGHNAARGTHLLLTHKVKNIKTEEIESVDFNLSPNKSETWEKTYKDWLSAVQSKWSNRVNISINNNLVAEVFSFSTCAIYTVPGPVIDPIKTNKSWETIHSVTDTRGDAMSLVYQPRYKRKIDLGGTAAGGGNSHCSWVSIKRVNVPHLQGNTDCQEIVCLFMGGQTVDSPGLRSSFLGDLSKIPGNIHLFGVQPNP
jgi:CRISPR-associated protein Cmr6